MYLCRYMYNVSYQLVLSFLENFFDGKAANAEKQCVHKIKF